MQRNDCPKSLSRVRRLYTTRSRLFVVRRIAPVLLLGLFVSCSEEDDSLIDFTSLPPFLSEASVSADTVNTDIPQGEDTVSVTISLSATARAQDPNGLGDIARVEYFVMKPAESRASFQGELRDDGITPDLTPSDGIYGGIIEFTVENNEIGNYIIEFFATDQSGLTSNAIQKRLTLIRRENSPPVISNVQAPDTVQLPQTGSVIFRLTVQASDPDGLNDIAEVFFRSLDSSDPARKFPLKDDGDTQQSGDATAGDGTYSILIQIDSTNPPGPFQFEFQAIDKSGAASNTILHTLVVIP